jgi:hypothetical protein
MSAVAVDWQPSSEPSLEADPSGSRTNPKRRRMLGPIFPPALWLLAVAAGAALGWGAARMWSRTISISIPERLFSHDDLVPVSVRPRGREMFGRWLSRAPVLVVRGPDGAPVAPIGRAPTLEPDAATGGWKAAWAVPWNAPDGVYTVSLAGWDETANFRLEHRKPSPLGRIAAVSFEERGPWKELRLESPDGNVKGWDSVLDWASRLGAGWIWIRVPAGDGPGAAAAGAANAALLPAFSKAARARGLKVGAWIDSYERGFVGGKAALGWSDGQVAPSKSVSLDDPGRIGELASRLSRLDGLREVDAVGLGPLGSAGGYELADAFFHEMPGVYAPEGWSDLSDEAQAAYLARRLQLDPALRGPWDWWRARTAARRLRSIKEAARLAKPLWVFLRGESLGRAGGQDAAMLVDAGADLAAIDLSGGDAASFNRTVLEWRKYLSIGASTGSATPALPVAWGDRPDWAEHEFTVFPSGPDELRLRIRSANELIAPGSMFLGDVTRAWTDWRGPYAATQWLDAARKVMRP